MLLSSSSHFLSVVSAFVFVYLYVVFEEQQVFLNQHRLPSNLKMRERVTIKTTIKIFKSFQLNVPKFFMETVRLVIKIQIDCLTDFVISMAVGT